MTRALARVGAVREIQAGAIASAPLGMFSGTPDLMKTLNGSSDFLSAQTGISTTAFAKYDLGRIFRIKDFTVLTLHADAGGVYSAIQVRAYGSRDDSAYTPLGSGAQQTSGFGTPGVSGDELAADVSFSVTVDDYYRYLELRHVAGASTVFKRLDQWSVRGF